MGICGFKGKIGNDFQFLIGFNCDSGGEKEAADQISIHLWFLITTSVPVMMIMTILMTVVNLMIYYVGAAPANQSRALDSQLFPVQCEGYCHDDDHLIVMMMIISHLCGQAYRR